MLPAASWIVAVSTRVRARGEVRGRAGERDLGGGAVDDGEGAEGAGGQSGGGRFHRDRSRRASPVIVLVATPATAVSLPVPVTVPAPEALAKATTVVLSEVTVLPAASLSVAVSTRVAPEVRFVGRAGEDDVGGGAVDDGEGAERAGGQAAPTWLPSSTEPTSAPVIVFVATPATAVSLPVPVTVPAPEALAKATTVVLSEVTVLPAASWIVAVRTRVAPEVEVRRRAGEGDLGGGAVDDGEGAERAGGEPGGGGFHRRRSRRVRR